MSLLIEQMTEAVNADASMNKTAEEFGMEKVASDLRTLDQARVFVSIGEELHKLAANNEAGDFYRALAQDTFTLGERMSSCLSKTASAMNLEEGTAIIEAFEIADDMHKIASVFADIHDNDAEASANPEFAKMAEVVVDIAVETMEEAQEMAKEAGARYQAVKQWLAERGKTVVDTAQAAGRNVVEGAKKHPYAAAGGAAGAVGGAAAAGAYHHYRKNK
jgi:hypothetical protein